MENEPNNTPPSVTQILNDIHKQNERIRRNRQNVAACTALLPSKEKLLLEASKSLEYYSKLVPELTNDISLMRKRLEFSLDFCSKHDDEYQKTKDADKLAAKILKLEKELVRLRDERKAQAELDLAKEITIGVGK